MNWYETHNEGRWHYLVMQDQSYTVYINGNAGNYAFKAYANKVRLDQTLGPHYNAGKLLITFDVLQYDNNKCRTYIRITVKEGYSFDGATCAPDFERVMRAALLHDALWQCLKCGVNWYEYSDADHFFLQVMAQDGFNWFLRNTYYLAVRSLGWIISGKAEIPPGLYITES